MFVTESFLISNSEMQIYKEDLSKYNSFVKFSLAYFLCYLCFLSLISCIYVFLYIHFCPCFFLLSCAFSFFLTLFFSLPLSLSILNISRSPPLKILFMDPLNPKLQNMYLWKCVLYLTSRHD